MPSSPITPPAPISFLEEARRQYRLLKIGVLALLALACAMPLSLNVVDPDLWGHVRYGQDWLAEGSLPRTATHTFTAVDYPWVNHENAAELLMALGFQHLGVYGMLVAKCLLGMAIVGVMAWTAMRHGVSAIAAWALMVLVSANMQAFFPMRPQLLSFALCTAALVCLDRGFSPWGEERRINFAWLWALPVLMAAWVNSHGGFVAGLCIVGAFLLGRMIEICHSEVIRGDRPDPSADLGVTRQRQIWKPVGHLAFIGIACVAATFVNPYGVGMHAWLLNTWAGAPPEITEWAAPTPSNPVFRPFVALLVAAVACLAATQRRRDWTEIVILSLVGWQACTHLRHIAFFALLCGFWLPVHWQSALERLRPDRDGRLPVVLPPLWLRMAMAAAILVGIAMQSSILAKRLSNLPVVRSQYPVDALQFMVDHRLDGKLVVAFNWAQYALAALAPDVTVGFDGRFDTCYPQEAIDVHFDFLLGAAGPRDRDPAAGPIDGTRVLDYHQPDMVLLERRYKKCAAIMQAEAQQENPQWTLLYSDSVAELWGRSSRFDDPASPDYLPGEARQQDVKLLEAEFQWPAMPDRSLWEEASASRPQPRPLAGG